MTRRSTFTASVESGALTFDDPRRWRAFLARVAPKELRRVVVTVERERVRVSQDQHGYYRAVVLPQFAEYAGYEVEEMHETLKAVKLGREETLPNGLKVRRVPSTADLSMAEMGEYLDWVLRQASECGLYIPGPNEPPEATL